MRVTISCRGFKSESRSRSDFNSARLTLPLEFGSLCEVQIEIVIHFSFSNSQTRGALSRIFGSETQDWSENGNLGQKMKQRAVKTNERVRKLRAISYLASC